MRWVLAAFVVGWSVVASAQTMTIPPGFAKRPVPEALEKPLPGHSDPAQVHVYGAGDVELTTLEWQWHVVDPTRSGLAAFDRDLTRWSMHDGAREVSNTQLFAYDPMSSEVFDLIGTQRIYQRRLYAVDTHGTAHVWWTICTGPATAIGACEQAQRTMKLDVGHAVTLPAELVPASRPTAAVKATAPDGDPDRPWTIEIPAGYRELESSSLEDGARKLRAFGDVEEASFRMFASPDTSVQLLQLTARMVVESGTAEELARGIESGLTNGRGTPRVVDNELVSQIKDDHVDRRTLYAADTKGRLYTFSVACFGAVAARGDCVHALATMRLRIPDPLSAGDPAWGRAGGRSPFGQLMILLFVVVIPLAAMIWLAKKWRAPNRRRRAVER